MLLEKLHAMTYAMQHGSYKEFEDARTELTIACRDADEKLAAAQQTLAADLPTECPHGHGDLIIDHDHVYCDYCKFSASR